VIVRVEAWGDGLAGACVGEVDAAGAVAGEVPFPEQPGTRPVIMVRTIIKAIVRAIFFIIVLLMKFDHSQFLMKVGYQIEEKEISICITICIVCTISSSIQYTR